MLIMMPYISNIAGNERKINYYKLCPFKLKRQRSQSHVCILKLDVIGFIFH